MGKIRARIIMYILNYETAKKLLFKVQPETAHTLASFWLRSVALCPPVLQYITKRVFISDPMLTQSFFGKKILNPVGLAAGFDKNGQYIRSTPTFGFGFTEIGTVTPKAQPGNKKPRLFRLVSEQSLQNAMGFNNKGADYMLHRLKNLSFFDYPVGVNIGKNKITPEDKALDDYSKLFETFKHNADYVVINLSSPNTPGLRDLQNEKFVTDIFKIAKEITTQPVLLKIAPDISPSDAIKLCNTAIQAGAAGIIATNTPIDYSLSNDSNKQDFGGISGELLKEKSFELFEQLGREFHDKTILISAGGIDSAHEAYRRIKAGASLVQVYTMLIYKGPSLIKEINQGLIELLKADGYNHISEAIGAQWRETDA